MLKEQQNELFDSRFSEKYFLHLIVPSFFGVKFKIRQICFKFWPIKSGPLVMGGKMIDIATFYMSNIKYEVGTKYTLYHFINIE